MIRLVFLSLLLGVCFLAVELVSTSPSWRAYLHLFLCLFSFGFAVVLTSRPKS